MKTYSHDNEYRKACLSGKEAHDDEFNIFSALTKDLKSAVEEANKCSVAFLLVPHCSRCSFS